jgi:hypothetical protein
MQRAVNLAVLWEANAAADETNNDDGMMTMVTRAMVKRTIAWILILSMAKKPDFGLSTECRFSSAA